MTALRLVALAGVDWILFSIPMVASSMGALRLGVRHPALLVGSALGGLALHGSIVFWGFYSFEADGRFAAVALVLLESGLIAALLFRYRLGAFRPIALLALPAVASLVFTIAVLSYAFVHGGVKNPVEAAGARFIPGLPVDNAVPLMLADAVQSDVRPLPDPLYSGWSASDRPPLQSGIYLSVTSVFTYDKSALQYSVVSSLLQSVWVLGIWAFFAAARMTRALWALTTAAVAFSGFGLANTLYAWPKLLSAAFLLILAAAFLTSGSRELLNERGCATVLGLNGAGALLAHGGATIALLALALTALLLRELPTWRLIGVAALVAAVVIAPWAVYQKVINPPGDRLMKLQVAGVTDIETKKSLSREIIDHYRRIGIEETVTNKLNNVAEPFRGESDMVRDLWRTLEGGLGIGEIITQQRSEATLSVRANQFFRLAPTLGLLALGPILFTLLVIGAKLGWGSGPAVDDVRTESSLALFLLVTIVLWSLIMFGPNSTVLHQGTYLTPLLAFILCTSLWWKLAPAVTFVIVALQACVTLYLYKDLPPGAPPELFTSSAGASMLALTLVSLMAAAAVLVIAVVNSPRQIVGD